jgi:hypothetical protein
MSEFRRLEESVEAAGVRIEKYRFVEKRLITRGIPTAEGGFHYIAEATDIFQLCITLTGGAILLEPGALQYMHGKIESTVQQHEDRGFLSRALASAGTGESAFATKFSGQGTIWTEPGRRNFIIGAIDGDALLLDDKAFYACSSGIALTTHRHNTVAGVLGGNGLVQPKMAGRGRFRGRGAGPGRGDRYRRARRQQGAHRRRRLYADVLGRAERVDRPAGEGAAQCAA